MTSIKLVVKGATAQATVTGVLTAGMVGIPVTIEYDSAWNGLQKTLVCKGGCMRSVVGVEKQATVAHEVMTFGHTLYLGIEGRNADSTLVIPTVWAECGKIENGANAECDETLEPEHPAWMNVLRKIGNLQDLETSNKSNLVAAINEGGGYYMPHVINHNNSVVVNFRPNKPGMPQLPDQKFEGLGRGIVSIARTSGTGAPGTKDTYTITYTDHTTTQFTVYHGKDGMLSNSNLDMHGNNIDNVADISAKLVAIQGDSGNFNDGVNIVSGGLLQDAAGIANILEFYGAYGDEPCILRCVANPRIASDAANKEYVDAVVGQLGNKKVNKTGWAPNMYLGTDANGNIIAKPAP